MVLYVHMNKCHNLCSLSDILINLKNHRVVPKQYGGRQKETTTFNQF